MEAKINDMDKELNKELKNVSNTLASIDERLKAQAHLRDLEFRQMDKRVTKLEEDRNKIVMTIILAFLGALFSLVFI